MNETDAIWTELYNAAKAVLKPRGVSSIIEAGRHAGRFDAGVVDIKRVNKTEKGIKKKLNFKSFPEARGRKEPRAAFLYAINVIQSIYLLFILQSEVRAQENHSPAGGSLRGRGAPSVFLLYSRPSGTARAWCA